MSKRLIHKQGFALITVVTVIGALAALAGLAALQARVSAIESRAGFDQLRLEAAVEGAIWRADAALHQADEARRWQPDGRAYELMSGDIRLEIRILANSGRFDLNRGDPEALARLLSELGVGLGQANAISAAMADWRDKDDDPRPGGAERSAYLGAGLPPPGDRAFLAREEFRRVFGVDGEIYAQIQPYLGVGGGELDPAFAPPRLLRALDLTTGQSARILAARRRGGPAENGEGDPAFDPQPGARYALYIEAETEAGAGMAMEVEIAAGGAEEPMRILRRAPLSLGQAEQIFEADA